MFSVQLNEVPVPMTVEYRETYMLFPTPKCPTLVTKTWVLPMKQFPNYLDTLGHSTIYNIIYLETVSGKGLGSVRPCPV